MIWGRKREKSAPKVGLILSGGGARAAYQVGVLKAIAKLLPRDTANPFPIICGTSAGAINAAAMASYSPQFHDGVMRLVRVWKNFRVNHVYRTDAMGVAKSGAHWFLAMMLGGLGKYHPHSLLDRSPLRQLLRRDLSFDDIQKAIDEGAVDALSITASSYFTGHSVNFCQSNENFEPWNRVRRQGVAANIGLNHLMASSAIPYVFSAVKIGDEYYGDGSMRQVAPISPALHLGAERVLVIGVRQEDEDIMPPHAEAQYPSLAQIAGHVLNSIFLDSVDSDLERLKRINNTIGLIPNRRLQDGKTTLKPVDVLMIAPSEDIGKIAVEYGHLLPWTIRYLLKGIGGMRADGSNLLSYLLFEKAYCRALISLGYSDAMQRRDEILNLLTPD